MQIKELRKSYRSTCQDGRATPRQGFELGTFENKARILIFHPQRSVFRLVKCSGYDTDSPEAESSWRVVEHDRGLSWVEEETDGCSNVDESES